MDEMRFQNKVVTQDEFETLAAGIAVTFNFHNK
jgi:hypothetical protein